MRHRDVLNEEAPYCQEDGKVLLSGLQCLVRLPLDQHRADQERGKRTATLISGYRGSPLGGLDQLLQRHDALLRAHHVHFIPGVNEELSATAIFGSQFAHTLPQPRYDGVLGMWYGKSPGVDRSGDIFKHANFGGIGPYGGVLAIAGDDPAAKSSSLPSHSEIAFYDALMPVLTPGTVQELLDFGHLGFELSRYCGLWVGVKVVASLADAIETVIVTPPGANLVHPSFQYRNAPWRHHQQRTLLPPATLALEQEIYEGRLEAAKAFAATHPLNRITVRSERDRIGIMAAGKTYYSLLQALHMLGLNESTLQQLGVRLLRVGLLFPLEPGIVRDFARGLEEVLVIEEKRGFLELLTRDLLYSCATRPRIVGKKDEDDHPLVPADGELTSDQIARILRVRLRGAGLLPATGVSDTAPVDALEPIPLPVLARHPYFCSGCSHQRSTMVPTDSRAAAGVGCHGMVVMMDRTETQGVTQMGGEGAQWVGMAPFTTTTHLFQNIGDGTFFHSGSLAIRQAIAAGTNVTYKILYNSAVGMTGGQAADGAVSAPDLTRLLEAEGVRHIFVVTGPHQVYSRTARWATGTKFWGRDELDEAQRRLREIPGVTVLIYDQPCAAEQRRQRKRHEAAPAPFQVFISEAVCEGCGDCSAKSACLSLLPVETEFGRKAKIQQSSCNTDYSCMLGECPAFVTFDPLPSIAPQAAWQRLNLNTPLPAPELRVDPEFNLYMTGMGGTGVVFVNRIVAHAAHLEHKFVAGFTQTGMSQKNGQTVSHLRIASRPLDGINTIATGQADCYLVFDIFTGVLPQHLTRASTTKTLAVVSSSQIPTGKMARTARPDFPADQTLRATINRHTRVADNVYIDTVALADHWFGDHLAANLILLGVAYQVGALPLDAGSLEEAIRTSGVEGDRNTAAFRIGRYLIASPQEVAPHMPVMPEVRLEGIPATLRGALENLRVTGELRRLLDIRVPELIAYQDSAYAQEYIAFIEHVHRAEQSLLPGDTRLSEAVARYLFKIMAYKDIYEVARLHLKTEAVRPAYYHLALPWMHVLGWKRKLKVGSWMRGVFKVLVRLRHLRRVRFDPLGQDRIRRTERTLIVEYRSLIERLLTTLTPATYEQAVQVAQLPDMIRGYGEVKLKSVAAFRQEVARRCP